MSANGSAVGSGRSVTGGAMVKAKGYGRVQSHGPAGSGRLGQLPKPLFCPEQGSSQITSVGSLSRARSVESLLPAGGP